MATSVPSANSRTLTEPLVVPTAAYRVSGVKAIAVATTGQTASRSTPCLGPGETFHTMV